MLASRLAILLVAGAVGAAFVVGLVLGGVGGAILLLAVAGVLAMVTVAAWNHAPARGRPLRLAVLGLVTVVAVVKLVAALS